MRRMLDLSKNALRIVTLLLIVVVPVWSQEESDPEKLCPDVLQALEIVQQVMESSELSNREEASEAALAALAAEFGKGHHLVLEIIHTVAVQLHQQGRYSKARHLFEQIVEELNEIKGKDHPSTLRALSNLAIVLQDQGDLRKALAIRNQVTEASSQDLGEKHLDTLKAKADLAETLKTLGDHVGARTHNAEVLKIRSRILGEKHPDTLAAKSNLAGNLFAMGEFAGALAHIKEVLEVLTRDHGDEHPDTLTAKQNLALILSAIGDLSTARVLQEEVLEAQSRILGDEHLGTLKTKANLAITLNELGNLADAQVHEEEVLGAFSRILGDEHLDTLTARAHLASTLKALGNLADARVHEEEVLEARIRLLGNKHPETLKARANLAGTFHALGYFADARAHQEAVLEVQSRILGDEHPDTLTVKDNLAGTLSDIGDLANGRARIGEILEAKSRILGDEHPATLSTKAKFARTLYDAGDLANARTGIEEVLEVRSRTLGERHPDTLKAKASLALTLKLLGDLTGARAHEQEVFGTLSQILGDEHPDTLVALYNLAVTYEVMGFLKQARSAYEKIIQIYRRAQVNDYFPVSETEAKTLLGLSRMHQAIGQLGAAQETLGLALHAIEAQTSRLDLSEATRRRYRASFKHAYHSALAVAAARRDTALALRLSERYRAGNLRSLRRNQSPESLVAMPLQIEQQLRDIAVEYDQITRTLDGLNPKRSATEYQRLIDRQIELRRKREVIQSRWLREQLEHRDQAPTLDVQAVKSQLDSGTALLIYNVGQDQTQLLVLLRDGELEAHSINLPRTLLRQQVMRFRKLVDPEDFKISVTQAHRNLDPEARDRLGRWLFTQLIPPDPRLESAERWLILSDGPLHMLPFGALIRPEDMPGSWHFLAQHKPLHTVQSLATYTELRSRRRESIRFAENNQENASWIGFGDPIYPIKIADLDQTKDSRRVLRIGEERAIFDGMTELPNTEREIQGISSLLPKGIAQVHLGAAATEEQAWADLARAEMIHFATHAVALPHLPQIGMDPMDSFLALSLFDEDELQRRQLQHNGLLQAWEIIDLKLNADLVVLSACQTALGEDQGGDGLISLSRAFQIAGARSVLASLWAVNDQSTAEFMIRFYKHLLAGKAKDVALQDTQREFIEGTIEIEGKDGSTAHHDFSHPYYWAAFQLIGDYQ